jgi:hypothetical protein
MQNLRRGSARIFNEKSRPPKANFTNLAHIRACKRRLQKAGKAKKQGLKVDRRKFAHTASQGKSRDGR